jgi:hypothetical protein
VPNACQLSPAYESEVAVLERPPLPVQYSRFIRPHYIYVGVDDTLPHSASSPAVTEAAQGVPGGKSAAGAPRSQAGRRPRGPQAASTTAAPPAVGRSAPRAGAATRTRRAAARSRARGCSNRQGRQEDGRRRTKAGHRASGIRLSSSRRLAFLAARSYNRAAWCCGPGAGSAAGGGQSWARIYVC